MCSFRTAHVSTPTTFAAFVIGSRIKRIIDVDYDASRHTLAFLVDQC